MFQQRLHLVIQAIYIGIFTFQNRSGSLIGMTAIGPLADRYMAAILPKSDGTFNAVALAAASNRPYSPNHHTAGSVLRQTPVTTTAGRNKIQENRPSQRLSHYAVCSNPKFCGATVPDSDNMPKLSQPSLTGEQRTAIEWKVCDLESLASELWSVRVKNLQGFLQIRSRQGVCSRLTSVGGV